MIILILILLFFLFWFFKPPAPRGVVLYFANVGTGKTTLLSKFAIREQKRIAKGKSKYKYIVSNAAISGVTYFDDIRKLMKQGALQNTLLLIDEGSIDYNNRKMNLTELEIRWFKLIRHYGCTTIVVSQSYNDIDVTLRRLYTEIYLLNYLPLFTLVRPIRKYVGIDEMTNDIVDKYQFRIFFSWRVFLRPLYFKFFNSWWIPEDIPIHDLSKFDKLPAHESRPIFKRLFTTIKEDEIETL